MPAHHTNKGVKKQKDVEKAMKKASENRSAVDNIGHR
jgi:hypothetical protein